MFTRKFFFALATVTTLGAAALAPSSASAHGFGGFGGGHFGGGGGHFGGFGGGHFGGGHFGGEHFGGWQFGHNHWDPGFHHPEHWHRCWFDCHDGFAWHQPHYGVVADEGYVQPVGDPGPPVQAQTAQASAPCNCLNKKYLDDGSVVFWDACTKEEALATPEELKAQAKDSYSSK